MNVNRPTHLESALAFPHCTYLSVESMPLEACQWRLESPACDAPQKPKPGDCCVLCSYGDLTWSRVQVQGNGSRCA